MVGQKTAIFLYMLLWNDGRVCPECILQAVPSGFLDFEVRLFKVFIYNMQEGRNLQVCACQCITTDCMAAAVYGRNLLLPRGSAGFKCL